MTEKRFLWPGSCILSNYFGRFPQRPSNGLILMAVVAPDKPFHEAHLGTTPIRELGLKIGGTSLEPIIAEFEAELQRDGVRKVKPRFYLSTEWGVPFGTVAIAIPFYLARPELKKFHAERAGHVEGTSPADILRYLRHEMGHVINYAYRLYEQEECIKRFGSITQPYVEEYRPEPFSRNYVHHLPGWYAQKHPDEDCAETFAIWMTPNLDWRAEYAHWPKALAKLEYCDRTMAVLAEREPAVTAADLDEDVGDLSFSLEQYYRNDLLTKLEPAPGLDGALRTIFEEWKVVNEKNPVPQKPAAALILRWEQSLMANVFRWTGHFPERTRQLLRHLAERADALHQAYPEDREEDALLALTTLVTALTMNHVFRGSYLP